MVDMPDAVALTLTWKFVTILTSFLWQLSLVLPENNSCLNLMALNIDMLQILERSSRQVHSFTYTL